MTIKYPWIISAVALIGLASNAHAKEHLIVAPQCLLSNAHITTKVLAKQNSLVLVKVNDDMLIQLSEAKHSAKSLCGGFKNVTKAYNVDIDYSNFLKNITTSKIALKPSAKYQIRYEKETNSLISQLNPDQMWNNLITFSSTRDRFSQSALGVAAANWLVMQAKNMSAERDDVSIYTIATEGHKQPSVVVKIGNGTDAGIVVGAHMDTTSSKFSVKPGADDDGSGSMTALEALRNVLASGMHFKKPVYFIWYAAEEAGLVGSQNVVAQFQSKNIPVAAVMHFDMTGYAHNNEKTIWIIDDYVNKDLTKFLETLITTYTKRPVQYTRCGYACSDHATWTENGYAAVIPAEARYEDTNPVLHSSQDTVDKLNLEHMTDYAKIATAFVVELAEPVK